MYNSKDVWAELSTVIIIIIIKKTNLTCHKRASRTGILTGDGTAVTVY